MDLSEEISANFEALPFAMASDSDNDAGTSVASDSGSHGPPCRIAAVVTAQQRECRIKILTNIKTFSYKTLSACTTHYGLRLNNVPPSSK